MFRKTVLVAVVVFGLLGSVCESTPFTRAAQASPPGRQPPPGPRQLVWEIIGHHPRHAPFGSPPPVVDVIYGSELDAQNLTNWWQSHGEDGWTYAYRKQR